MKCKHDPADAVRELIFPPLRGVTVPVIRLMCRHCGAWLSLGPANEDSEAVRIEMRAAEMLACHEMDNRCRCFHPSRRLNPIGLERQARDLADEVMRIRAIHEHEEG